MKSTNIKKIISKKAGISYLQIFVLILSTFAFCYFISYAKPVEAQSLQCCKKTKSGATCQEYIDSQCTGDNSECSGSCLPTRCAQATDCQLGCCYDSKEGLCARNTPKASCEGRGNWSNDASCNIPECSLGCCVLGSNVQFVTDSRCTKLSSFYGLTKNFRSSVRSEIGCLALAGNMSYGACIINDNTRSCKFLSKQECIALVGENNIGNFHENYLCSNPELNTTCKKQDSKGCVSGKDEVYWLDSCGNRENIYSSDTGQSWNYGKVLGKAESCNPSLSNAGSQNCGNCNRFIGSFCGLDNKNKTAICKDLNCKNAPANGNIKKDRRNGESWCVYDGAIGEGKDVVGSRHFRYNCINGEVKVEPCADYRNQICAQQDTDVGNNEKFSQAACIINSWQACLGQKGGDSKGDCISKNINIDEHFKFSVSVPRYPPGFDLRDNSGSSAVICAQASQKCTVVFQQKSISKGCECVENCNCLKQVFSDKMNEWCTSLGDCGGKANIAGKVVDSYHIGSTGDKMPPKPNTAIYASYANAVAGQVATSALLDLVGGVFGITQNTETGETDYTAAEGVVAVIGGASGVAVVVVYVEAVLVTGATGVSIYGISLMANPALVAFANAAGAVAIAATVTLFVATALKLPLDAAIISVVVGVIAAVVAFLIIAYSYGWSACLVLGPAALPCIILVGIIGAVIGSLTAWIFSWFKEDCKPITVAFDCLPWTAPVGGADCDKCNTDAKDFLKPCSRYRCESLGQACKFMNEGTGKEICVASVNDHKAPSISPLEATLTPGYKYQKTEDGFNLKKENDECIDEFTSVTFGIKTDEMSQCKIDFVSTPIYENMSTFFGGFNLYDYNHSMMMSLPSVESIAYQFNVTTQYVIEKFGNLKLYTRCQDDWGNYNLKEYVIGMCVKQGPDLTPPLITSFEPASNSYLAYGKTELNLTLYTNEPANCSYDSLDKEYSLMQNKMSCDTSLSYQTAYGFPCHTVLNPTLQNSFYNFYFRCKDKPWLAEDNETRNVNQESFVYTLKPSSKLSITRLEPNWTITQGVEPATITLTAETSGGAENGKAVCNWQIGSWTSRFFNTNSVTHTQTLNSMTRGNYNLKANCTDVAGNTAFSETTFTLNIDISSPQVVRVYNDNALQIVTDENALCSFSKKNCYFDFENATLMLGNEKEHNTEFVSNSMYYIKCKDLWGNKPDGCSIIVRAYQGSASGTS